MLKINACILHHGNLCWQHCLKEVIFPFYLEAKKCGIIGHTAHITIFSIRNPLEIWGDIWNVLFPNFTFSHIPYNLMNLKQFDIIVSYVWPMFPENHYLYNKNITIKDIDDFCMYIESVVPKPDNTIKYDIILIKRNHKNRESYYKDVNKNSLFGGMMYKFKYIENSDDLYIKLVEKYPNKKILYVDLVNLSFAERYYLFNNAKLLIGQHGAAMVQTLFIPSGSHIIEFSDTKFYGIGFTKQIAKIKNLVTHYCIYEGLVDQIININIDKLMKHIDKILNNNSFSKNNILENDLIISQRQTPNGKKLEKIKYKPKPIELFKNDLNNVIENIKYNRQFIDDNTILDSIIEELLSINEIHKIETENMKKDNQKDNKKKIPILKDVDNKNDKKNDIKNDIKNDKKNDIKNDKKNNKNKSNKLKKHKKREDVTKE